MPSPQYNPRRPHKPAAKKRPSRSGASPVRGEGAVAAVNVPWWLWLVGGIAVGVFVSFLIKLAGAPAPAATAQVAAPLEKPADKAAARAEPKNTADTNPAATPDTAAGAPPPPADAVTKFDFYTLLPEREVIVPADRETLRAAADKQKAQTEAPEGERFQLQVGSFRSAQEAERRRGQIAALKLDARIEPVQAGGDTWYRVQAGPFASREQLGRARDQLKASGLESIVLKQKQ